MQKITLKDKTIFVTGSAGFIVSSLDNELQGVLYGMKKQQRYWLIGSRV